MENSDITVVVQGPVHSLPDREQDQGITQTCLASIRSHLPGARIILSTWPDQDLGGLEYDELLINDDPGPNVIGHRADGKPRRENYNRQIVTSKEGLKRVRTPYAMKLRADNFLDGNQFKRLQNAFPVRCDRYRFLSERVVVNNTFTREYAKGLPVVFHSCDFFYFGRTDDVLALWDLPLFEDRPYEASKAGVAQHHGAPQFPPDATQDLWLGFLNQHLDEPLRLAHMHDVSGNKGEISAICYANNLIVGAPEDIGLGLPSKFTGDARVAKWSSRITFLSHFGWQLLYKRHCDPAARIERRWSRHLGLSLSRAAILPAKNLEARARRARNQAAYARASRASG